MRKCPYCGLENPDDAFICSTCHTDLLPPSDRPAPAPDFMSAEEQQFWNKLTFHKLAVLLLRLSALWLFFNALLDLIVLVEFTGPFLNSERRGVAVPWSSFQMWMVILRIALHAGAGYALMRWTNEILRCLMKDQIAKQVPPQDGGT